MAAPKLVWPCNTHTVTCGFYCYPFHYADDLGASFEECRAGASGFVITADNNVVFCEREGRYIEILHADGWVSRYFHLSRIDVAVGQYVTAGQHIGVTGASGWFIRNGVCTPYAPHLHWALHAPTYAEALTVWESPQQVPGGRFAVSPVWAITHQQQLEEEEDDVKVVVVKETNGFHYEVRSDGTRAALGHPRNAPTVASSEASANLLVALGLATMHPTPVDAAALFGIPPIEDPNV